MRTIIPVILSGGSGTRLWPMSTPDRPKQFLSLTAEQSMFQLTALRTRESERFGPPIIVANARHAALIEEQLSAVGIGNPTLILEPCARNTAPAIALAALEAGDAPILVMPSDHVIANVAAFHEAIDAALPQVEKGWLATFGIAPTGPETGYGYIRKGGQIAEGVHQVDRFVEKPDLAGAEAMVADGQHLWNGGIFLFRADAYLEALGQYAGAIVDSAHNSMEGASRSGRRVMPDAKAFEASPSDSIDYAIMEKAARVAVAPVNMGWSDVGSWDSLYALARKDEAGNAARGDVRLSGTSGMMVDTDGVRISASGVDNLIVIASGNEVLILPRGQSQDVRKFAK